MVWMVAHRLYVKSATYQRTTASKVVSSERQAPRAADAVGTSAFSAIRSSLIPSSPVRASIESSRARRGYTGRPVRHFDEGKTVKRAFLDDSIKFPKPRRASLKVDRKGFASEIGERLKPPKGTQLKLFDSE